MAKVDKEKLLEDYDISKLRMEAQIAELRLGIGGDITEGLYKEHGKTAVELNNHLMTGFRVLCTSLRAAAPAEADAMKLEHDAVFKEKIPILEKILADLRKKTTG